MNDEKNFLVLAYLDEQCIGTAVFRNCYSLTDVDVSNAATIEKWAFRDATALEKIDIHSATVGPPGCRRCVPAPPPRALGRFRRGHGTPRGAAHHHATLCAQEIGDNIFMECTSLNDIIFDASATMGTQSWMVSHEMPDMANVEDSPAMRR